MKIECVALTHNGVVRDHNEDSILCEGWLRNEPMIRPSRFTSQIGTGEAKIFAVSDGLGGHNSGEVASQLALVLITQQLVHTSNHSEEKISALLNDIHFTTVTVSRSVDSMSAMGATIAGLCLNGLGKSFLFNVGDSRIYRRVDRFLEQLSLDDRAVSETFGETNRNQSNSNLILQCIGGSTEFSKIQPHVSEHQIGPLGETYLICSDGLSDMLSQDEIELAFAGSLEDTVMRLFQAACDAGGRDNISIIIIEVSPDESLNTPPSGPSNDIGDEVHDG